MEYEIFTKKDGKKYVVFKNASFASSKNYNGVHFDPLEVFSVDHAPDEFNQSHISDKVIQAKFNTGVESKIEGKLLRFFADIESDDDYVVENVDKVSGFSPELVKVNQPAVRGNERFYGNGDLQWKRTAVLFGEEPGFVGADQFDLERFSVTQGDDIVIIEKFDKEEEEPEHKGDESTQEETKDATNTTDEQVKPEAEEANEDAKAETDTEAKRAEAKGEEFNLKEDLKEQYSYITMEIKQLTERLGDLEIALKALTDEGESFDKVQKALVEPKQAKRIDVEDNVKFSKGAETGSTEKELAEIYKSMKI